MHFMLEKYSFHFVLLWVQSTFTEPLVYNLTMDMLLSACHTTPAGVAHFCFFTEAFPGSNNPVSCPNKGSAVQPVNQFATQLPLPSLVTLHPDPSSANLRHTSHLASHTPPGAGLPCYSHECSTSGPVKWPQCLDQLE
jgi:hypothetical protein